VAVDFAHPAERRRRGGDANGEVLPRAGPGISTAAVSETARMLESRESFRVAVEQLSSSAALVTVGGDVDLHSAPILRDELTALAEADVPSIVLDLSDATFLDSMALGVILAAKKQLTAEQGQLELVVPTPEIRRIFEITMLDRVFALHETRAEALRAERDAAA
jgi:anti-sigma B factor antagonist